MLTPLIDRIETLTRRLDTVPRVEWVMVTSLDPLQVRLGGAAQPLPITPATIYRPKAVGERVLLLIAFRRAIVLGVAGGPPDPPPPPEPPAPPPPGHVVIGGQTYATSGSWPSETLGATGRAQYAPLYVWSLVKQAPYVPPAGWTFAVHMTATNGHTVVTAASYLDGNITVRVISVGHAGPNVTLGWQLVRV